MFVLGKKTIDSVNCLVSGTLGTSAAFSAGALEIFFPKAFGAAWALLLESSAGQCELWLGWRCHTMDGEWVRARCLVLLLLPNPLPARRANPSYLAPCGAGMPGSRSADLMSLGDKALG